MTHSTSKSGQAEWWNLMFLRNSTGENGMNWQHCLPLLTNMGSRPFSSRATQERVLKPALSELVTSTSSKDQPCEARHSESNGRFLVQPHGLDSDRVIDFRFGCRDPKGESPHATGSRGNHQLHFVSGEGWVVCRLGAWWWSFMEAEDERHTGPDSSKSD